MRTMNRRSFCWTAGASLGGLVASISFSQEPVQTPAPEVALFQAKTFRSTGGEILPYRLFVPKDYRAKKIYPLVLWLHGGLGRGSDNLKQLTGMNTLAVTVWTKAENQDRNPCIVVVPQCPENKQWIIRDNADVGLKGELSQERMLLIEKSVDTIRPSQALIAVFELIETLQQELSIDQDRIYVSGQSMGGAGTWALIAAYPEKFAAAVPICGTGAVPSASRLTRIAIWTFHGDKDQLIPVDLTRRMIEAIKQAGGQPRYTELPGADHPIADQVFSNPEVLTWVFAQRRRTN